ncbi:SU10 major capsid protein [Paraburkholderia graminis]
MANIVNSYAAAVHNREDLGDKIWNIAPDDTWFLDNIGKTTATNNLHEWLHDTLPTPSLTNAVIEGTDAVTQAQTPVTRIGNYTQNLQKVFGVSDRQKASDEAGMTEVARLTYNNMKAIKLDMEATLLERTSGAVGDGSTTASTMKGVAGFLVTNALCGTGGSVVAGTSSTTFTNPTITAGTARALTEDMLISGMQKSFSKGGKVSTLLVSPLGKSTISGFQERVQKFQDVAQDSKVYHTAIDVYDSDFGAISIVPSIVLSQVSSTNAYGLDVKQFALAEKQSIGMEKLARTGTYDKYMVNWEATLEVRAEEGSFIIRDLSGY